MVKSEYYKSWRIKNKVYLKNYKTKYRKSNKEKVNKYNRDWRKLNFIKEKLRSFRRIDKRIETKHQITEQELTILFKLSKGNCNNCNKYFGNKLTVDHICPLERVGKGAIYNIFDIQFLCKSCNCTKKDSIK